MRWKPNAFGLSQFMDRKEAATVLDECLGKYRNKAYSELVPAIGSLQTFEAGETDRATYQVEVQVFWDDKPGGDIRIIASIDDGGIRAFFPLTKSLVVSPVPSQN